MRLGLRMGMDGPQSMQLTDLATARAMSSIKYQYVLANIEHLTIPKVRASVAVAGVVPVTVGDVGSGGCVPYIAAHELRGKTRYIPILHRPLHVLDGSGYTLGVPIPVPSIKQGSEARGVGIATATASLAWRSAMTSKF